MSRFKVGQKVVCINDKFHNTNGIHWACPKKGDVLTVLDIRGFFATPYLSFEELDRDSFFQSDFFAPIEENTDEYSDTYSIAIQLVQELEQVDKSKEPQKQLA